jgi:hypothetical protein
MSQAYCDQYGCPDDFYDMPIWYGPVFYEGVWFAGPVYYRVTHGQRQYWIHGGWHFDTWRGPHPSWWNAGHYRTGPALGRANYRNHGAGTTATSVRVWRGTQASTYSEGGNGRYYHGGFGGREIAPQANMVQGVSRSNSGNLHAIGGGSLQPHRVPQYYYGVGRNFGRAGAHSFSGGRSGGHHGR